MRENASISLYKMIDINVLLYTQIGSVSCNICGERFSTKIHKLSEAIDVYSEWIDACEAENT